MRSIIQFQKPLSISDDQGNKLSLEQLSGDISISGSTVHFQPSIHQVRDAINKKAMKQIPGSGMMQPTEVFVLTEAEVQSDEEMSILLEQIRQRATDLIKVKLDTI